MLGVGAIFALSLALTVAASAQNAGAQNAGGGGNLAPPANSGGLEKPVGYCNTATGCRALKNACLKLRGHSFHPADAEGTAGVCDDGQTNEAARVTVPSSLRATGGSSEDAKCFSLALCNALAVTCAGEFTRVSSTYGVCKDRAD